MPTEPLQSRGQKRSAAAAPTGSASSPDIPDHIRKVHKVSRACDQCKARKTRCSGTLPCERCVLRRLDCVYDAEYARGRPPTPPPSLPTPARGPGPVATPRSDPAEPPLDHARPVAAEPGTTHGSSPEEVEAAAEADRQDFDPTSGLAFFQRAHQRLVAQHTRGSMNTAHSLGGGGGSEHGQLLASAGDKPLLVPDAHGSVMPGGADMPPDLPSLVEFYFETCVVTYRMFAQQSAVASWARAAQRNARQGLAPAHGIGHAKAAIVLAVAAVAVLKSDRAQLRAAEVGDERPSLRKADRYYAVAASLVEAEVGLPCLESVQARLVQVLYLLQTSRMNKAWYLLGTTWQIAAALGLHRRQGRQRGAGPAPSSSAPNYVLLQGQRRTFWVAYTIDVYLSAVLGRPRHTHDDDIDQELPASVRDEDMGPDGPVVRADPEEGGDEPDSNMDSVIAHAQLAEIIGTISSKVYSIKNLSREERLAAASQSGKQLSTWRSRLPPHLSSVQPRSLIPTLRRQALAMRLAYCHAVMHAHRPFLLGGSQSTPGASAPLEGESVAECMAAAKTALRTVQSMAADSTLLHAFWWTPYVTFCALAVVYVWEIQQSAGGGESSDEDRNVLELAEKCHARLAQSLSADSPSWRYTVILEELRHSAQVPTTGNGPATLPAPSSDGLLPHHLEAAVHQQPSLMPVSSGSYDDAVAGAANFCDIPLPFFQEWQTTDWRDLDASAFGLFGDPGTSMDPFMASNSK